MNRAQVLGQIRHVVTALGGAFVGMGIITAGQNTAILDGVGAAVVLIGMVWSWLAPEKQDV